MNKVFLSFLILMSAMSNVMASCQDIILERIGEIKSKQDKQAVVLGSGVAVSIGVTLMYPAVGGAALLVLGSVHKSREVKLSNLNKLSAVIKEAYQFEETNAQREYLPKLHKKVLSRSGKEITVEELVSAIIYSNEKEQFCRSKGLNSYAKSLVKLL